MEMSLNKDCNGIAIDFDYFCLHLINQNGKLGFLVSSNHKIEETTAVVLPNRGLEYNIYNIFRDFIARVIGTTFMEEVGEIKKYTKGFIKMNRRNRTISLKGYDNDNNFAMLSITYNIDNEIKITIDPKMVDRTYYFSTLKEDNKEYYGACLNSYAKMIDNLNEVYFSLIGVEKPVIKPDLPEFREFKVMTTSKRHGMLENSAYLENYGLDMAILEDNLGAMHLFSSIDLFIISNNSNDKNERKVFNLVRETMELIFGYQALNKVSDKSNIKTNFIRKRLEFNDIILCYNDGNIIFDFSRVKKYRSNQYHAIIEMVGGRAGAAYNLKRLLYNLIATYDNLELEDKKGSTLERRK